MTEPDDRELEQYLKGGGKLSARYREAGGETTPPGLDEVILAQAKAELRRKPNLNRYLAPVALAASLVLAVNLAWNLYEIDEATRAPALEEARPAGAPVPAAPAPVAPPPAATPEPRLRKQAVAEGERRAAAQAQAEERASAERKEAEPAQKAMLQSQDAAGASAPAAAPLAADSLERTATAASDARGTLPAGWHLLGAADRYEAALDESTYHTAPDSLVMWRSGPGVDLCGRLQAEVPATQLRGKDVRAQALVRTQGSPESVAVFISYVRGGSVVWPLKSEFFSPAESAWRPAQVTASIPGDADRVVYGALLCGAGTLWVDDVVLEAAK